MPRSRDSAETRSRGTAPTRKAEPRSHRTSRFRHSRPTNDETLKPRIREFAHREFASPQNDEFGDPDYCRTEGVEWNDVHASAHLERQIHSLSRGFGIRSTTTCWIALPEPIHAGVGRGYTTTHQQKGDELPTCDEFPKMETRHASRVQHRSCRCTVANRHGQRPEDLVRCGP